MAKGQGQGKKEGGRSEDALVAALREARGAPAREELWDAAEAVAATQQKPDEVAALYREMLAQADIGAALASMLGQRAVRFHEEWFGDSSAPLVEVLERVLEIDPGAEWALQRLTVVLTVAARWEDLLGVYDRALAASDDPSRRMRLLDEAANVAKDFAGQADRAIGYLQALLPLRRTDARLASSLERLLERRERWRDLIAFWKSRLDVLPAEDAAAVRLRIAACWLERMSDPGAALQELRVLLHEPGEHAEGGALLERILAGDATPADVRAGALGLLRDRYKAGGQPEAIVRAIDVALRFADAGGTVALQREAGERLAALGDLAGAMERWAVVLLREPRAVDAQDRLRQLAEASSQHEPFAVALVAAAEASAKPVRAVALLVEAAQIRQDVLSDDAGAIALQGRVLAHPGASDAVLLDVARRHEQLLERAGRAQERLAVLARLAAIEPRAADRRAVLGQAARLADELGDPDRALEIWGKRLSAEPADLEALDATVQILERERRWEPLVEVLRRRAAAPVAPYQRRADLVRVAQIHATEQKDDDAAAALAVDTWREVGRAFGEDAEVVAALNALLGASERWPELGELLDRAGARDLARLADIFCRLGDAERERLSAPDKAAAHYRQALDADARHAGARAGLNALLADERGRAQAAEALARAYEATDEWEPLLGLLEHRVAAAAAPPERARLLTEAAGLYEKRGGDRAAALAAVRRALALVPQDVGLEHELMRLAETTGDWAAAAGGLREAARAAEGSPERVAHLMLADGGVRARRLDDAAGALEAYEAALRIDPRRREAVDGAVRAAATVGKWETLAGALVASSLALGRLDAPLVGVIEALAEERKAWNALAPAAAAAAASAALPPALARELEARIALWHRDRRADPAAAEDALLRALLHDGPATSTIALLRLLADVQRSAPGRALLDTLVSLADADALDLDPLHEAAAMALDPIKDLVLARKLLTRLVDEASRLWRRSAKAHGKRTPDTSATWALEALVGVTSDAGEHAVAAGILAEAARWPFTPDASRALRHRAALLILQKVGDRARAVELYRGILEDAPRDLDAIAALAALYEQQGRLPELLALKHHELGFAGAGERRLELRLDVARLVGNLEERGGRLEALRANLEEQPGHGPTIEAVYTVLAGRAKHGELADLLSDQAGRLETQGDAARSAKLWARVALLAERDLNDVPRALAAHRRVAALAPPAVPPAGDEGALGLTAVDALARLHTDRAEHPAAVEWLERRLAASGPGARTPVALRLARAHLGAGQPERAVTRLERAAHEDPPNGEVRDLLAELYRKSEAWERLARLLTEACTHVSDDALVVTYAREAADLYHTKIGAPDRAIPVLERAVALVPEDRWLRSVLADGLRVAGRLDEARKLLAGLIEGSGRRRSAERATLHRQLAQVARAQGDVSEALAQLELASSMDVGNVAILEMLAALAREAGQLERAERAYRGLLLILRRAPEAGGASTSEVLFHLHRIAGERSQPEQARELLESALAAAGGSDAEARGFKRAALAHGEPAIVLRALEARLAADPPQAARVEILCDLGETLEALGRGEDALDARLRALDLAPERSALHDTTRAQAAKLKRTDLYVKRLSGLVDRLRRKEEARIVADCLLRAARAVEEDQSDLGGAASLYRRVESTGEPGPEQLAAAWAALARIGGVQGDTAEQTRVLDLLVLHAGEDAPPERKADALFRVAEVQLGAPGKKARARGLEALSKALDQTPDHARALALLRTASIATAELAQLPELLERIARGAGDPTLLLEWLEQRAGQPGATADQVREAVEAAVRQGEAARGEALLVRAIEVAKTSPAGLSGAAWAPLALARRRQEAGDLEGAVRWLEEGAEVADPTEVRALGLELAAVAGTGAGRGPALAARIYERLLEREQTDRALWEPLLRLLATLGERARLDALVASTLDVLADAADRNWLRVERARFLIALGETTGAVVDALQDALLEDPEHIEATSLLADLFARTGQESELADLLWRQLNAARERKDATAVTALSLRLGALLEPSDRKEAMGVYRGALDSSPSPEEERALLEALLKLFEPDDRSRDRAEGMERLLGLERGAAAVTLATELASMWEALEDEEGIERALRLGVAAAPDDAALHQRLEDWYRARRDWARLSELRASTAERASDPAVSVRLFRDAAAIQRDELGDAAAASELLRRARAFAPADLALLDELARALAGADRHAVAIQEVSAALEDIDAKRLPEKARVDLLRLRADMHLATDGLGAAVEDLEKAFAVAGGAVAPDLIAALERRQERAAQQGDAEAERATTLRLADVLGSQDLSAAARDLMAEWVERSPSDVEALHRLADMDAATAHWEGVAAVCHRLVGLETGEAQVQAAIRLADACERAGRPGDALAGLEEVYRAQPASEVVRGYLRRVYEQSGARRQLADILVSDAASTPDAETRFVLLKQAGELLLQVEDGTAAVSVLEAALGVKPGDHDASVLLVDAQIMAGDLPAANALLGTMMAAQKSRRSPKLASLQHRTARIARAMGDRSAELEWLKQAFETDKKNGDVAAELADLAEENDDLDVALKALQAVTLFKSPGPLSPAMAFFRQARIMAKRNDAPKAVLWAKRALQEDPNLSEASEFLREIEQG